MKPLRSLLSTCLVLPVALRAAQVPTTATSDRAEAARGNNEFAIELYGQMRNQTGNLFFSPESISTALAMTYAGARADTAAEMAKTLHFTMPAGHLHPAMGALLRDRNAAHDSYQLKEADALWVQTAIVNDLGVSPLRSAYLRTVISACSPGSLAATSPGLSDSI